LRPLLSRFLLVDGRSLERLPAIAEPVEELR
jgi:hypothetical protein